MITSTSTIVKVDCVSKKESHQWGYKSNPKEWDIELAVHTDQNSVFFKQSGGTNFTLKTINQEAAGMFIIGNSYDVVISPSPEPVI